VNLQIALRARAIAELTGIEVIMTRDSPDIAYPDDATTIAERKKADQHQRAELIRRTDNAVLISIHQNCLPGYPLVRGAQSFYNGAAGGQEMADLIQQALNDAVNVSAKESKRISDSIYLMKHAECPAVLVECGFLSNREETTLLQQPEYQVRLAAAIAAGYLQYCTSEGEL